MRIDAPSYDTILANGPLQPDRVGIDLPVSSRHDQRPCYFKTGTDCRRRGKHQSPRNPFNPSTTIAFDIPVRSNVRLTVYDVLGREVAVLFNGVRETGRYSAVWNASNAASGMYFFRLEADRFTAVRKMLLMK